MVSEGHKTTEFVREEKKRRWGSTTESIVQATLWCETDSLKMFFFLPESSRNVCAKLKGSYTHFLLIVLCSFKKEITVGTLITLICYHYACGSTQQSPSLFLNPLCQCTMWYVTLQTWFLQSIWYRAKSYQLSLIGFFYLSIYSLLLTQLQIFIKLVGSNLPSWCPVGLFYYISIPMTLYISFCYTLFHVIDSFLFQSSSFLFYCPLLMLSIYVQENGIEFFSFFSFSCL